MSDGRLQIGSSFLKIGSSYLRIGPAPSPPTGSIDFFINSTVGGVSYSDTGTNPQDVDRIVVITIGESCSAGTPTVQTPGGDLTWTRIDAGEAALSAADAVAGQALIITAWWALMTAGDPASPSVTYTESTGSSAITVSGVSISGADTVTPIVQYATDIEDSLSELVLNLTGFASDSFAIVDTTTPRNITNTVDDFVQIAVNSFFWKQVTFPPASTTPLGVHITGFHGTGTKHTGIAVEIAHV